MRVPQNVWVMLAASVAVIGGLQLAYLSAHKALTAAAEEPRADEFPDTVTQPGPGGTFQGGSAAKLYQSAASIPIMVSCATCRAHPKIPGCDQCVEFPPVFAASPPPLAIFTPEPRQFILNNTRGQPIVTIDLRNGTMTNATTPNEAARLFWKSVSAMFPYPCPKPTAGGP